MSDFRSAYEKFANERRETEALQQAENARRQDQSRLESELAYERDSRLNLELEKKQALQLKIVEQMAAEAIEFAAFLREKGVHPAAELVTGHKDIPLPPLEKLLNIVRPQAKKKMGYWKPIKSPTFPVTAVKHTKIEHTSGYIGWGDYAEGTKVEVSYSGLAVSSLGAIVKYRASSLSKPEPHEATGGSIPVEVTDIDSSIFYKEGDALPADLAPIEDVELGMTETAQPIALKWRETLAKVAIELIGKQAH